MKKEQALELVDDSILKGICHRGLHNDKFPENSMSAFKNAIEHNLPFELDIHLSRDGALIVCHDSNLKRVTGNDGIIEELDLKDIKDNYKLGDGSSIPTLDEVLKLNDERVLIVIELKSYNHNSTLLAKKLKEALKNVKNKKKYALISFFPRCLFPFKNDGYHRELLVGDDTYYLFKLRSFFEGIDVSVNLFSKKKVRNYAKKHFVNCYTIDSNHKRIIAGSYATTFTFENLDII